MTNSRAPKGRCVFAVLTNDDYRWKECVGVAYLTAVLRREGHYCEVIEVPLYQEADAISQIMERDPHFVGMSISGYLPRLATFGRDLRAQLGPNTHICAGGPMATFAGEHLLTSPDWDFVDSVVRGEGESIIGPLIAAILVNRPVDEIEGVTVRDRDYSLVSMAPPIQDLDTIPWPARDQQERSSLPMATVLTSRGCTGCCAFCNAENARNKARGTKVWRGRDPKDIVDEVESLMTEYGIRTFELLASSYRDPGGRIGKHRVRQIAQEILDRELGIYYGISVQACNWTTEDGDLLALLYRSGLERVFIGIESGSNRVLKMMKKRSNVDDNKIAIKVFRKHSIYVQSGMIMFYPYADWQDLEATADFIFENLGYKMYRLVSRLELYPGTEIAKQLTSDGLAKPSFEKSLDPYGYRFAVPEIGRLSDGIAEMLSGPDNAYLALQTFVTYDLDLHTYLSRLDRAFGDNPLACEAILKCQATVEKEQAALTRFNEAVWEDLMTWGRTGQGVPMSLGTKIRDRYAKALRFLKSAQLRVGIRMGRHNMRIST